MEGESSQQQPPDAANEDGVPSASGFHLDPKDIQIIVDSVTEQNQARQSSSSLAPVFKREGYAKQYEFNASIIRKLLPLQEYQEISLIVSDAIHDLQTRNETLKIVDDHPEVFQFLENKSKAETLKTMDPKLGEFMETLKKKDEEDSRKRKISTSGQPFRKRGAAWPPASPYPPSSSYRPQSYSRLNYDPSSQYEVSWARPPTLPGVPHFHQEPSVIGPSKGIINLDGRISVRSAVKKDIGGASAHSANKDD
ncbi:unnamed protein product [Heligmosomoides polygyrus]|uniref:ING domain-containing protein n=1 Tax=Heligmosomoides polygyrus TaxID=6339 RepID=A0A183GSH3_HELPZ|nr:unnamed protein product [Heligmosomoides polygyrus]